MVMWGRFLKLVHMTRNDPFVLPILENCSLVWGQLLNVTSSFLIARCIRWPGFVPIGVCCRCVVDRRRVAGLSTQYKVNSNSNHCLFSELPSASTRVRHTRAAAAVHPLEFEISRYRTSKFAWSFLPSQVRMWNHFPYNCV